MKFLFTTLSLSFAAPFSLLAGETYNGGDFLTRVEEGQRSHLSHHHDDLLGLDFTRGWLQAPRLHDHSEAGRSRYIHPLTIEAAFNDNDLFFDYVFSGFDDEDEHEIEIELELALTTRLGIIFETAYEFENEDGDTEEGFSDIEIAARVLLVEFDRFISTVNIGFQIPTGDDDFSSDELVLEPTFLNWFDLGKGFTLNTNIGFEIGTQSDEFEFLFDVALVKDIPGPLAFTLEIRNEVDLQDEDRGDISSEGTLGAIYRLTDHTALRAGWSFPITDDEFRTGGIVSYNYSF